MDLSWHALRSRTQVRTHCHAEKQGFGYLWLSRKIPHTPTEAEGFRKVNISSAKLVRF